MSIMKRMRDITVATLNDRLEQSEDPVRLIDGYLAALLERMRDAEKLHAHCSAHVQSVRQQYLTALHLKEKREEQAVLALKAGEDHIARIALQDKLQQEEKAEQYGALYEEGKRSLQELEEQLGQLKSDYDEVAAKRGYYHARMEALRLQQQMNARMAGMAANPSPRAFQRLDERLSDLELEACTLRDVRRMANPEAAGFGYAGSRLQNKLDYEMDRLRMKLESKLEEGRAKLEEKLEAKRRELERKLDETLEKTLNKEGWDKR